MKKVNNQKGSPRACVDESREAGVAHLLLPIIILLIIGVVVYFLFSQGIIKNPFQNLKLPGQGGPSVSLKSEYNNPFDKNTQYVNPFEGYKNPFVVAK